MELQYGDNFLGRLQSHIENFGDTVNTATPALGVLLKQFTAGASKTISEVAPYIPKFSDLERYNPFPDIRVNPQALSEGTDVLKYGASQGANKSLGTVGAAGDYLHAMVQNGASADDVEEFMRQYQATNDATKSIWTNVAPKMGSVSMGAILPPFLDSIMQNGLDEKNKQMGGT